MSEVDLLGWCTPWLILHDRQVPGVIRRVLKSSALGQQAVYAALAHEQCEADAAEPQSPGQRRRMVDAEWSAMLRYNRPADILATVFGYGLTLDNL